MADEPLTAREAQMAQTMSDMQNKIDEYENATPATAPAYGLKAPRVPAPDKYHGPPKGDVAAFLMQLNLYVAGCANDAERIAHTGSLLTGSAVKWHMAHGCHYTKFADYCAALSTFGTDPRKYERAVSKLRRCLQNGRKILHYDNEFTATALELEGWPEQVLLDLYLDGLDSQVRAHVEARGKPTGVIDAQRAAVIAAGEAFAVPTPTAKKQFSKTPYVAKNVRFQEPQPMEIGTLKGGKKATSWPPPHPPNKPCTVCGKGLHWAIQCPVVKAASSN
jgi:hypothetical protein